MMRITLHGDKDALRFVRGLPQELNKQLTKDNLWFMKKVRTTAKKMAPRDTETLANSIRLKPVKPGKNVKKWRLTAGGGPGRSYAAAQEEGFKPHKVFISGSNKMSPGIYWVKKNKPFIQPAIEKNIGRFMQKLDSSTTKAIKKKY